MALPVSAAKFKANLLAITLAMLNLMYFKFRGVSDIEYVTRATIFTYASIVAIYELLFLKPYLEPTSGLNFKTPRPRNTKRILIRILGLLGSISFIALLYLIFKEYHGEFYRRYWNLLIFLVPYFIIIMPSYFYWIDAYQNESSDIYYRVGRLLLLDYSAANTEQLKKHFLGWIIKGFFFPLMYVYALDNVDYLLKADLDFKNFVPFYDFMWHLIFGVDVLIVSIGYIFTTQVLDSHLRSPQPRTLGWVFALICYQPFWSVIGSQYLGYDDKLLWDEWLIGHETIKIAWGLSILALISIYSLATVAFGLRFSNLTNRGIITGGPYRWTKHPAYIAKNMAWWMVSVPFISQQSSFEALRNCCALILLNLVYYVRAKTEESHLQEEPRYREYSEYIAKHGIIARMGKWF